MSKNIKYQKQTKMDGIICGLVLAINFHMISGAHTQEKQLKKIIELHEQHIEQIRALHDKVSSVTPPAFTFPSTPSTLVSSLPQINQMQTRLFSTFARNARRLLK